MTSTTPDWRIELLKEHPRLFHGLIDRPYAAEGYPNCEEGWRDLLERCCARIEAALADGGALRVLQIKEKFGALRFYWSGDMPDAAKAKVEEAIALAVARSTCTCEICGAEGRLHCDSGLLMTRCAAHAQGHPVPEKPVWENVTISRVGADGSKTVIVKRRRYVRETDSFVEIDSLIIGEGG